MNRDVTIRVEIGGRPLAEHIRDAAGVSWNEAKRLIASGKVFVDEDRATDPGERIAVGRTIALRMAAPRPRDPGREVGVVYEDPHLVVIDKPSGISTVPFDERETDTAMDRLRVAWRRMGRDATGVALHVVHRIDKDTSGLVVFAKTKKAEVALAAQFRARTVKRRYLCVAHGDVVVRRIESRLVRDRGDGLRGSARGPDEGKRAVTHVEALERLARATVCAVRLETGKTHQIRIHLAEAGHPLVGETVYVRDFEEAGGKLLTSARLLLHAATLGFAHPVTGARVSLSSELPSDFTAVVQRLT
jgi:23S rRNA pseudouridine1911/1915/1917 synthase